MTEIELKNLGYTMRYVPYEERAYKSSNGLGIVELKCGETAVADSYISQAYWEELVENLQDGECPFYLMSALGTQFQEY